MGKFIYAFDVVSQKFLADKGYALVKSDLKKDIYVFAVECDRDNVFELKDRGVKFVLSDTLMF